MRSTADVDPEREGDRRRRRRARRRSRRLVRAIDAEAAAARLAVFRSELAETVRSVSPFLIHLLTGSDKRLEEVVGGLLPDR